MNQSKIVEFSTYVYGKSEEYANMALDKALECYEISKKVPGQIFNIFVDQDMIDNLKSREIDGISYYDYIRSIGVSLVDTDQVRQESKKAMQNLQNILSYEILSDEERNTVTNNLNYLKDVYKTFQKVLNVKKRRGLNPGSFLKDTTMAFLPFFDHGNATHIFSSDADNKIDLTKFNLSTSQSLENKPYHLAYLKPPALGGPPLGQGIRVLVAPEVVPHLNSSDIMSDKESLFIPVRHSTQIALPKDEHIFLPGTDHKSVLFDLWKKAGFTSKEAVGQRILSTSAGFQGVFDLLKVADDILPNDPETNKQLEWYYSKAKIMMMPYNVLKGVEPDFKSSLPEGFGLSERQESNRWMNANNKPKFIGVISTVEQAHHLLSSENYNQYIIRCETLGLVKDYKSPNFNTGKNAKLLSEVKDKIISPKYLRPTIVNPISPYNQSNSSLIEGPTRLQIDMKNIAANNTTTTALAIPEENQTEPSLQMQLGQDVILNMLAGFAKQNTFILSSKLKLPRSGLAISMLADIFIKSLRSPMNAPYAAVSTAIQYGVNYGIGKSFGNKSAKYANYAMTAGQFAYSTYFGGPLGFIACINSVFGTTVGVELAKQLIEKGAYKNVASKWNEYYQYYTSNTQSNNIAEQNKIEQSPIDNRDKFTVTNPGMDNRNNFTVMDNRDKFTVTNPRMNNRSNFTVQ